MLARLLGERRDATEQQLLVVGEEVLLADVLVARVGPLHDLHGQDDQIAFARVRQLQRLPHVTERVVVARQAEGAAGPHLDRLVRDELLRLQPKLIHFDVRCAPALALVDALGGEEDGEEDEREGDAADGRHLFCDEVDDGDREEDEHDHAEADGNLFTADAKV